MRSLTLTTPRILTSVLVAGVGVLMLFCLSRSDGGSGAVSLAKAASPSHYALAAAALNPSGTVSPQTYVEGAHGPYSTTATDECATCHRSHTAKNSGLLTRSVPQSTLCFTCHDGTGAGSNVLAQYRDPLVPANDTAVRSYYSHDALVPTAHTLASLNQFAGVLNRESECGDCHNPHTVDMAASTETTTGWTASGPLSHISGVSVVNGSAGTQPAYTFLDGVTDPITREYQLCFKCHSGFTVLPPNTGFTASQYLLDKAVEFNPNNPSFHPVEAPGTNATQKMNDSLAGTSPYKQWSFTSASTIRCSNCHASYTSYNGGTPPSAGSDLNAHTSKNAGILIQNYRDRVLKSNSEAYSSADFALCFMCHGDYPFTHSSTTVQTNFSLHNWHVASIAGVGSGGTDIDTPGAGQGNALCSECHFRLHSTTYAVGSQSIPGTRLVSFAPNVTPNAGVISWAPGATGHGSCTLTCHGVAHNGWSY